MVLLLTLHKPYTGIDRQAVRVCRKTLSNNGMVFDRYNINTGK